MESRGKRLVRLSLEKTRKAVDEGYKGEASVGFNPFDVDPNDPFDVCPTNCCGSDIDDPSDADPSYVPRDGSSSSSESEMEDPIVTTSNNGPMDHDYVSDSASNADSGSMSEVFLPALGTCGVDDGESTSCQTSTADMQPGATVNKSKYRKPKRPCIFCKQFFCNLTLHIKRCHKDKEHVQRVLKLDRKGQIAGFDRLRKDGIFEYNKNVAGCGNSNLLRERSQGKGMYLKVCGKCHGFFSRNRIYAHKKICDPNRLAVDSFELLAPLNDSHTIALSEDFKRSVVSNFRTDEVGAICRTDIAVLLLGDRRWASRKHKNKKSVMTDMRLLGNAIFRMQKKTGANFKGEDLLKRKHFDDLKQVIVEMTSDETGEETKSGLRLAIGYVIKRLINIFGGFYVQHNRLEDSKEVDLFKKVFEMNWPYLFHSAQIRTELRRNTLRKPTDLPLEDDIKKLREFMINEMKCITDPYKVADKNDFVKLRNLIVARLTLFNARRGGEAANMLLSDWKDAETGAWIDPQLVNSVDEMDKYLLDHFKLAYHTGKGNRLVPILIPEDTVGPLKLLVEIRQTCNVLPGNPYLFPSTKNSTEHAKGWNCINYVTQLIENLDRPDLLIADRFRHRASTLFALMDVPADKREAFYKHMGHSEKINKDVYQTPLALNEVTQVGKYLLENEYRKEPDTARSKERVHEEVDEEIAEEPSLTLQENIVTSRSIPDCDIFDYRHEKRSKHEESQFPKKVSKQRKYHQWNDREWEKVRVYFRSQIEDTSSIGTKGPLPGKAAIANFLKEHKILEDLTDQEKSNVIKTKIFNERIKYRKTHQFDIE